MLSFLKKKSDAAVSAAASASVPAWHPNFRNFEKLPDIKVVRTAFFVNGAAVFVALAVAIYFGMQEYQLRNLNTARDEAQRQIDAKKPGSDRAVALYKKFQAEEAKMNEVEAFVKSKPSAADLLIHLGQTLPSNIAFDSIDLRENGLVLRVTVRGTSSAAAGYSTNYLEQLKADKALSAFDSAEFAITNSTRNASTGRLSVEMFLRLKGAKK